MIKTIKNSCTIILCPECHGYGYRLRDEQITLYDSETVQESCWYCCGSGRVVEATTVVHKRLAGDQLTGGPP